MTTEISTVLLVFGAQGLLFMMYAFAIIKVLNQEFDPMPDDESSSSRIQLWFSMVGAPNEKVIDKVFMLSACVLIQCALEKLMGRRFSEEFSYAWGKLLQASGYNSHGSCDTGVDLFRSVPDQLASAASWLNNDATQPSDKINKTGLLLRIFFSFVARSIFRRFILYTLPILILSTAHDALNFVKDILAFWYIAVLDTQVNEEVTLILLDDDDKPIPPATKDIAEESKSPPGAPTAAEGVLATQSADSGGSAPTR